MSVKEIFETMAYGAAPESAAEALAWLVDHGSAFGHFIDGTWTTARADFESRNPANGEILATHTQGTTADIDAAVAAARKAQAAWAKDGARRAKVLYALARLIQKNARLLAVIETLDNGKPIRETRDIDIPLAARHFYYHAGMAQLMADEMPDRVALGVCGQIIPWNFPLLMLAWKIAPALAMGNTVVLKPAEWTPLSALVFAELCLKAGVPNGVVNIVTGDGQTGAALVAADVNKVAFTGSTEVGRRIREETAGRGIALTLELGGKSPYIVFDDADLDSAVEGLVDAIWFNAGQVCCAGSRLLVQASVADGFHAKLRARMETLRVGDPLDKCIDMGAVVHPEHLARIQAMVSDHSAGVVYHAPCPLPQTGAFYPPTLITGLDAADPLMQQEIFGPVLVSSTFRTPDEAVALANNTRYGLAATVWSENINRALDIAPRLAAGVVWINATNLFDASAGFGGVRESGFGREGGWTGLTAYTKPRTLPTAPKRVTPKPAPKEPKISGIDQTAKLYIGGKQARPDGGYVHDIWSSKGTLLGQASSANRKDLRNAVEAMNAAAGWGSSTAHLRAQILYYLGENLAARAETFSARIKDLTGKAGDSEVEAAVDRLFTWAAWADKHDGRVAPVPMRGVALAMHEPVGKIVAFAPDETPLLGLVSIIGPAMAMGNRLTVIASEPFPLAATDFYQVIETSDVPAGVVNILTGAHDTLAPHAAAHLDVDAVWSFSGRDLARVIEGGASGNLKRTWVGGLGDTHAFLDAATEVKTVWVPYGA